jgi:hypothetical protein
VRAPSAQRLARLTFQADGQRLESAHRLQASLTCGDATWRYRVRRPLGAHSAYRASAATSRVIRGAAVEAIRSGTEQITRKLLNTIDIDHDARQDAAPRTPAAHQ